MKEAKKKAISVFHKNNIKEAAKELFTKKGIEKTTMDDIAKTADYSKATIYVYYKNKDEIVSYIIYDSMNELLSEITKIVEEDKTPVEKYYLLCNNMVYFQRNYPLYFELILNEISMDFQMDDEENIYKQIYEVGEEINNAIGKILIEGINQKVFMKDLDIVKTVMVIWASVAGCIRLASQKERYFNLKGFRGDEFLKTAFDNLLNGIMR